MRTRREHVSLAHILSYNTEEIRAISPVVVGIQKELNSQKQSDTHSCLVLSNT